MALTLTEIMIVPGTGNKKMAIWKVTGDGTSTTVALNKIKMNKVEAAWTVNLNSEYHRRVSIETYDYIDGYVSTIEIGDSTIGEAIQSGTEHLLVVVGY